MEILYIAIVVILFTLAISDLIVGVSNDAVNFLNSAIGSKVASVKTIMIIAALGVLIGATFSNGMMEVARKGVFYPQNFYFNEIMIIFLAVMLTDVILLDFFNTIGLPTSTTVSIVFELLGAAVAIALYKINVDPNSLSMPEYINTANALRIIGGILFSIVIAFSLGAIIQYISRIIFSFNFTKNFKFFGPIWSAIAISSITYFILIKGAKSASFMTEDVQEWIKGNTLNVLAYSIIGWFIILQLVKMFTKWNILKFVVFVGTFALAMAFAGNDLVNFIGVPLAGFESFKIFRANGAETETLFMTALSKPVKTDTYMLLIAGLIMVITLWLSKKARGVVQTSLDLSRQQEGEERFGSSVFSRSIVRTSVMLANGFERVLPAKLNKWIDNRFVQPAESADKDAPVFDLIRASVNLMVASIIISYATSQKLPLSTTYVTFMVAMGSSLADRAWGRESAVYRITGVLSVIGGWFFTALAAFTVAFIVALIIRWGGIIAILVLSSFAAYFVIRTHVLHKRKTENIAEEDTTLDKELEKEKIIEQCTFNVQKNLLAISKIYGEIIEGLYLEDRKRLRDSDRQVVEINKQSKRMKDNIVGTVKKLKEDALEAGQYYIQVLDYLREMSHALRFISEPSFHHIDNQHKGLKPAQSEELKILNVKITSLFDLINQLLESDDFEKMPDVLESQHELLTMISDYRINQIKRIKRDEVGTKNSILYMGILNESKNFLLQTVNLLKAHRDFIHASRD